MTITGIKITGKIRVNKKGRREQRKSKELSQGVILKERWRWWYQSKVYVKETSKRTRRSKKASNNRLFEGNEEG